MNGKPKTELLTMGDGIVTARSLHEPLERRSVLSKERVGLLDLTVHLRHVTSLVSVEPVSDCFQNFEHVQKPLHADF